MLIGCSPVTSHHATTLQPTVQAGQPASPPGVHHQTPSCNLRVPSVPLRARVQCRPAYITVATRKTTATVERRLHYSGDEENNCNSGTSHTLQWRRGKQLQQWNVAYSGDEENNCNSELQDIRDIETVNYSDIVRKGNYRNEHVQITANV
ncbi:hypothetical protein J6590_068822 [Homalodisca vitripennis]|nr:hypothetical protein J6590_068822 [Homalodisca vitripennis]